MGVPAQELQLDGPDGTARWLVQARLGPGSETTAEWAVIDPDRPHVLPRPMAGWPPGDSSASRVGRRQSL